MAEKTTGKIASGLEAVSEVAGILSYLHSGLALLKAALGHKPDEEAKTIEKMAYGLFSNDDELRWLKIVRGMKQSQQKEIRGWIQWQFPTDTPEKWIIALWFSNKFRKFVLTYNQDDKEIVRLITDWLQTIKKNGGGVRGYRALEKELRGIVPLPPKNAASALREARDGLMNLGPNASVAVQEFLNSSTKAMKKLNKKLKKQNSKLEANEPWYQKLVQKCFF